MLELRQRQVECLNAIFFEYGNALHRAGRRITS
jgi:hypothetical protein